MTAFSCPVYAVKGGLCPAALSAFSTFIILSAAGGSGGASVGGVGHVRKRSCPPGSKLLWAGGSSRNIKARPRPYSPLALLSQLLFPLCR